jgi:GNAT superfamily N-acetyltransferase
MSSIDRLQSYLRESARQRYDALPAPPFTVFVNPSTDFSYFNYAIPDQPVGGDLRQPLDALRAVFAERRRQPRFEFIEEFAPELAPALRAAGFEEESRTLFMICTPETYRPAPETPGLTITVLDDAAPFVDVYDFLSVQRESFDEDSMDPVTEQEVHEYMRSPHTTPSLLARVDGHPAGVGSFTAPLDGLVEVAGIGTRPAFRRRGVATAVTARTVEMAFAQGVEIACLSAADERAGRVYERVGFQPFATTLAYREAAS